MKLRLTFHDNTRFALRGPNWLMRLRPFRKVQHGPYLLDAELEDDHGHVQPVAVPVIVDAEGLRSANAEFYVL